LELSEPLVVPPVAGVVLGIYADRVGRNAALTFTIFTMGLGTGLIVLPFPASAAETFPQKAHPAH
jgi:MFS family permease